MNLALIGDRGHQEYVFEGLQKLSSEGVPGNTPGRLPEVSITAITMGCEEDDARDLLAKCESIGCKPRLYADYRELLDLPDIDAVSICGPFQLHASMSIEALERGLHVFCEKPVATTIESLAQLTDACSKSDGCHFGAMMGLRYDPAFYTAWQAVKNGAIGEVRLMQAQKSYKLGKRPEYYTRRETYGGTIPWVGSHAIDWIYWFSGARFRSVSAVQSRRFNNGNGDLEISAQCQFELEGEISASVSLDYLRPGTASSHGDDRIRAAGTQGVIEVRQGKVFLTNQETDGEQQVPTKCDRQVFSDFVNHILTGTESLLPTDDIFTVTEASLLAQKSADEGRRIEFRSNQ